MRNTNSRREEHRDQLAMEKLDKIDFHNIMLLCFGEGSKTSVLNQGLTKFLKSVRQHIYEVH